MCISSSGASCAGRIAWGRERGGQSSVLSGPSAVRGAGTRRKALRPGVAGGAGKTRRARGVFSEEKVNRSRWGVGARTG